MEARWEQAVGTKHSSRSAFPPGTEPRLSSSLMEQYRHTQIGWVIVALMAAIVAVVLLAAPPVGALVSVLLLVTVALFGTLTITVDREAIRFHFGIGIIRRRFPLATIRSWREVRNRWWYGWGIRIVPGGMLYNVSGLSAVELLLEDGRRVRLGTDEPDALARALVQRRGTPPPFEAALQQAPAYGHGRWVWLIVGLVIASLGTVLYGIVSHSRPPEVVSSSEAISISSGWYNERIPYSAITSMTLDDTMPRVLGRPNGYALGSTLRGHFVVEGLGRGRLFLDRATPPVIVIRKTAGFTILNLGDAARTRALYERLMGGQ